MDDHLMTDADWVEAARLALPCRARLTGITRLQQLGLGLRSAQVPLHFVIEGELHLDIDGIFLHRTKRLAPTDERRRQRQPRPSSSTAAMPV